MQIEYRRAVDLSPYPNNSRTHSQEQVDQIAGSIQEFGFTNPILIDEDSEIIAGHGRLEAAKALGMDEVPTIVLEGLTDSQKRAYVIADNKLALNAGWNEALLRQEIMDLRELDFDISLTGFTEAELLTILLEKEEGETDPYEEWEGMPEFDQRDEQSYRHVIVHFETPDDAAEFFSIIGQRDSGKTKSIWFPEQQRMDTESKRYG